MQSAARSSSTSHRLSRLWSRQCFCIVSSAGSSRAGMLASHEAGSGRQAGNSTSRLYCSFPGILYLIILLLPDRLQTAAKWQCDPSGRGTAAAGSPQPVKALQRCATQRLDLCCCAGSSKAGSVALQEEGSGLKASHSPSSSAAVSQSPWEDLSLSDSIAPQESSHADLPRTSGSTGKNPALMSPSQCLRHACSESKAAAHCQCWVVCSDRQINSGKSRKAIRLFTVLCLQGGHLEPEGQGCEPPSV